MECVVILPLYQNIWTSLNKALENWKEACLTRTRSFSYKQKSNLKKNDNNYIVSANGIYKTRLVTCLPFLSVGSVSYPHEDVIKLDENFIQSHKRFKSVVWQI